MKFPSRDEKPQLRASPPPRRVDRIIVHQFDPLLPAPGGIDTCLRGIVKYLPSGSRFAFVGVDACGDVPGRRLGEWEEHDFGGGKFWFMPVARFDRGNQNRRVPHTARLVAGTLRFRSRLPESEWLQAHKMEAAWALRFFIGKRTAYFLHTQENGLTGSTSDSFWRFAGHLHKHFEQTVVRDSSQIVVFNERYAQVVKKWNSAAQNSPTWFDPELIVPVDLPTRDSYAIIWVGRLETPKDPRLAIEAFRLLVEKHPNEAWRLDVVGSGTRRTDVDSQVAALAPEVRRRVTLHGRTAPATVGELMARAGLLLMTSHAGYEGYPRVLVEALASGLPAVVTDGADTGDLVKDGENGFRTTRDPYEIAERLRQAAVLPREIARASVERLSAPEVIATIYSRPGY